MFWREILELDIHFVQVFLSWEIFFPQLYNLSDNPERKEFLDKLFDYMQKKGHLLT